MCHTRVESYTELNNPPQIEIAKENTKRARELALIEEDKKAEIICNDILNLIDRYKKIISAKLSMESIKSAINTASKKGMDCVLYTLCSINPRDFYLEMYNEYCTTTLDVIKSFLHLYEPTSIEVFTMAIMKVFKTFNITDVCYIKYIHGKHRTAFLYKIDGKAQILTLNLLLRYDNEKTNWIRAAVNDVLDDGFGAKFIFYNKTGDVCINISWAHVI